MRLRQRMKVDLPQPDGPMIAVTPLAGMSMSMPCSTSCVPNQALRPRIAYLGEGAHGAIGVVMGKACD